MSVMKVKTPAKMFNSDLDKLQSMIVKTMDRISGIVGSSLGPGGRNVIIESDLPGIPNKNTKDGVSIFRSLGSNDAYEHLIIEQTRDVAVRTVNEAGDGTTTATIIAAALIKNLFSFCGKNRKYSPQKVARIINKKLEEDLIPFIRQSSININNKNKSLLTQVATVSVNGDKDMANSVIEAFEIVGYGSSSHVTIQELSGPSGKYEVKLIEGFPIEKGYEESIGKFHAAFINDQANQRCLLENPLFVLFDGKIRDLVQLDSVLAKIGGAYAAGNSEFKNVIVIAHEFSDQVLTALAYNFSNPGTINVVPLRTPMNAQINSELNFLKDVSAFTGAKIFDMNNPLSEDIQESDLGKSMHKIEIYRFRSTIVGDPDEMNIEVRADEIRTQMEQSESILEKRILEERLGKLTNGIAQLKIYGSSNAELKEKSDRAEDAVCAVRAAITHGCLPGGCRVLLNIVAKLYLDESDNVSREVIVPSLLAPFYKLLDNAGYNDEEIQSVLTKLMQDQKIVYDVENAEFGDPKKLGIFDATLAVEQALKNAVSIASVMGTLGGIVAFPRDRQLEIEDARDQANMDRTLSNARSLNDEANERY